MSASLPWPSEKGLPHDQITQAPLFDFPEGETDQLRTALKLTLCQMREVLHRSGRLSSRHEALDELGKLLFSHVMSVDSGGSGINTSFLRTQTPAVALREFVSATISEHLPRSLSHELRPEDFHLRIKDSEERFTREVIKCFEHLASPQLIAQIRGAQGVDVLNDVFGNFIADSFSDEKELGQYLTPPEVVRYMVRVALQSLDRSDLLALSNPIECSAPGLIVDPSCGVGSFLSEVLRVLQPEVQKRHGVASLPNWTRTMMSSVLVGIDKSERMIKLALTNLALFGVPAANLHLANALVRKGADAEMTKALRGKAKIILTNPPFGAEFSGDDLAQYKLANEWTSRPPATVDSELLFLERYLDWLSPDGVLVAVVPDSVLTNRALFADLRRGLAPSVVIQSVTSLPAVTFGVAGTSTKTSILHLKKVSQRQARKHRVYFGICEQIGFGVATRGSQRHKIATGSNDLPQLLQEIAGEAVPIKGRFINFASDEPRWDATFHAGLPTDVQRRLDECGEDALRVSDIAELVCDRIDPRRSGSVAFEYIEISDVNPYECTVRAKSIATADAPSRARKRVRAGDVLVSTVRPERKAIGVVPDNLDGSVCSTGFAVLRCTSIQPIVLARLLQSDFVNAQILRNNVGIAYPAVEEACFLDAILPIRKRQLTKLEESAKQLSQLRQQILALEKDVRQRIEEATTQWV